MKKAEESSFQLDSVLNMAATATLGNSGEYLEHNASSVSNLIIGCSRVRDVVFHNIRGNDISPNVE
jgi:hypothetical protein